MESRSSAALVSSAMPPGSLSLTVLIELVQTRAQRGVRLAFLKRHGQIDFRQRRLARRSLRLRRVHPQAFEPYIVAAPLRRRLHLIAQALPICDEPRMQARRPGQNNPHRKEPPCRRLGMRAHFRLDRAKQGGLVIVRRGVDEDLRPARGVRHDAPHLRYDSVCDVDNDRPPFSAFSDTAALEVARIDDPGIPRDDFVGVDVAERPIVITARCEVGDRARRVVFMARAPASGVQDADVEPASNGFWIVDSVVLKHLTVGKAASVQRDAQILDAVALRPPCRKLKNALRPSQGFGDEAFGVMIAAQEEGWNAAI